MNVERLRADYVRDLGPPDNGYALPVASAEGLVAFLDRHRPQTIADLGVGFSTVVFHAWGRATVTSFDHDVNWISRLRSFGAFEIRPLADFFDDATLYDFVFVDHGPTMETRVADIPRIVERVMPGGVIVLDDWRGQYRRDANDALWANGFTAGLLPNTRLAAARRA